MSIFFNFPPPSNAMFLPSGDQNGGEVDDVSEPGSDLASNESRARSHRRVTPSEPAALKANRRPSGETANVDWDRRLTPSGGIIGKRITSPGAVGSRKWITAIVTATSRVTPAVLGHIHRVRYARLAVAAGCSSRSSI